MTDKFNVCKNSRQPFFVVLNYFFAFDEGHRERRKRGQRKETMNG
jgi:hypothetical protein